MKRIWFTVAVACLAISSSARADIWGRIIPNTMISQNQDKAEALASPKVDGPVAPGPQTQAPIQAPTEFDGYPFADRCGCNGSSCCANVWDGYSRSCGCGHGRGLFGHHGHHGCGKCGKLHHGHGGHGGCCGASGCGASGCGGCGNSFAGGGCGSGIGMGHGLGFHSGGLHGFGGCGCGCKHHLHHCLRRLCGFDCGMDGGMGSMGCSTCGGNGHESNHSKGIMAPPTAPVEPTPAAEQLPPAPAPAEQSAFRTWPQQNSGFLRGGF
jgi:hypothetical protein